MAFSIQTNVNSLIAQENLRVNSEFQTRTINRLTSGYRINSSGDDAAGLAVANKFRSDVSELTQGVHNANDGVSQLQIADGGMSNISKMLDRMKTLATQSASTTFTGNRNSLNTEFQQLISEITRQATNVGLNSGGTYNKAISTYIGGSGDAGSNAVVTTDLSASAVDSASLGISTLSVAGGGNSFASNAIVTDDTTKYYAHAAGGQAFTVNYVDDAGARQAATVSIAGNTSGLSRSEVLNQLNSKLQAYGLSASFDSNNKLVMAGARNFSVTSGAATGGGVVSDSVNTRNDSLYWIAGTKNGNSPAGEAVVFTNSDGQSAIVSFQAGDTTAAAVVDRINAQTKALGMVAVVDATAATGFVVASASKFTVTQTSAAGTAADNAFGGTVGNLTVSDPTAGTSETGSALAAITSIAAAVTKLGQAQGVVGAGQNKLQYAIGLAQSQIANFSAAESRIRDADVAAEAANLTKAQVLQQASMAAMAQANTAPQAVLALLRG